MHANTPRSHHPLLFALTTVSLFTLASAQAATLQATWATKHQPINAKFDADWSQERNAVRLEHGWLFARNDAQRLYLLIDLTGDTGNDKPLSKAPWGDYLSIAFDIDRDKKISVNKDIQYGQYPGTYRMGRQYFLGAGRFTGLQQTKTRLAAHFDRTVNYRRPHRIWELSIPLAELNAKPGASVRLGISTHSTKPAFSRSLPPNHTRQMKNLIELRLAGSPMASRFLVARLDPKALRKLVGQQRIVVRPKFHQLKPVRPGPGTLKPVEPTQPAPCPMPEGEPVGRAILQDGSIELRYANGSKKHRFQGGWKILCPDGTPVPTMVLFSSQIPPTLPPLLPEGTEAQWLEYHNTQLLGIINTLVDDASMVDTYLKTEAADWSVYKRIQTRGETISYLLAE